VWPSWLSCDHTRKQCLSCFLSHRVKMPVWSFNTCYVNFWDHLPWSSSVTCITICFVSVSPAPCNPSLFEMYSMKLECKVLLNQTMLTWLQLRAIKNFCLENVHCLLVSSADNFSDKEKFPTPSNIFGEAVHLTF